MVGQIQNGKVTWQRVESLNHEALGYFLSCHLIIEHYMDEYLKTQYLNLDWDAAKLTFGQKVQLLSKFKISDKYDCIPAIKHLNSIRNRLSHNIEERITVEALLPLTQYLNKVYEGQVEVAEEPTAILHHFTSMASVLFASIISRNADAFNIHR